MQFAIELPCLKPGLLRLYICLGLDIHSSYRSENFPNSSWARGYFRGNPWTGHQHRFGGAAKSYDIDRAVNGINNVGLRFGIEWDWSWNWIERNGKDTIRKTWQVLWQRLDSKTQGILSQTKPHKYYMKIAVMSRTLFIHQMDFFLWRKSKPVC